MKLEKDKCLKCGSVIIKGGRPLSNYIALGYNTIDGNIRFMGLCTNCNLLVEDYKEATRAISEYEKKDIPEIVSYWGCEKDVPVIQGEVLCANCNKEIIGNYYTSKGKYFHEACNV